MTESNKLSEKPFKSLVSPLVAAILSALLPGLGQIFTGKVKKGLLILASFLSSVGLWVWRMMLTGRLKSGFFEIVSHAFRMQPILLVLLFILLLAYIAIIIDAWRSAQSHKGGFVLVWVLILSALFLLGWQIGEIRPASFFADARKAMPLLGRILWPWDRAITRPAQEAIGVAEIQLPCGPRFKPKEIDKTKTWLNSTPNCGDLSTPDGNPGTTLHLEGFNYIPNGEVEIWWQDDMGNEFRHRQDSQYTKVLADDEGKFALDVVIPYRVIPQGVNRDFAVWQVQGRQTTAYGDPEASEELKLSIEKMIETIILGMMSTFFGILLSIPVSFLAAKNLMSANWFTKSIYYLVRTILNIIRSIEPLVWAVIAIIMVGLGPFAGILALTIHTVAALGKLYSEAIESIDNGPMEAIKATGANWLQIVRYAVIPQIIPPFVSFTIYRWDINVRMSTVIGMVGGGGIGFLLVQWIRLLDYKAAGIAIWFIAVTVAILDYASAEIRNKFV